MTNRVYGYVKDKDDSRDLRFMVSAPVADLPLKVDLRSKFPMALDQGPIGSCTAHAISSAVRYARDISGKVKYDPSRLQIYYDARELEGTADQDAGAMIRSGFKALAKTGAGKEEHWPYIASKFKTKPSKATYGFASYHKALEYRRLDQNLSQLKSCLASGTPFVFGFTVYESFESTAVAKTGVMTMPEPNEAIIGAHAVLAVGYDDAGKFFWVRNSWGPNWGLNGFFKMPYEFALAAFGMQDIWTLTKMG